MGRSPTLGSWLAAVCVCVCVPYVLLRPTMQGGRGCASCIRPYPLSPTILDVLKTKHPAAQPATADALLGDCSDPPTAHPIIFDKIDAISIRSAALATKGAAGPSGLDAHCWRRLCTSFQAASQELCHSLALVARRLCTSLVDPRGLSSFLACRLIALDKCPGVRPIGVCETIRRIVAKAILYVTKQDIQEAAGTRQLCGGQIAGIEAVVHSVWSEFHMETVEAVFPVDASNAFNCLNPLTGQRVKTVKSITGVNRKNCFHSLHMEFTPHGMNHCLNASNLPST